MIDDYSVSVEYPLYLWLLAITPLLWFFSRGSLRALGPMQRPLTLLLRTGVIVLIVLALADLQLVQQSRRLTVLYCLDQSLSIPEDQRAAMLTIVNASIDTHQSDRDENRAGVVVFGADASVEAPPLGMFGNLDRIETPVDAVHTNLSAALETARATLPADTSGRIVLMTDGNQTRGDALSTARTLADSGISIDVVPVVLQQTSDISFDKLTVPANVRKGTPFELRSVLSVSGADPLSEVKGLVRITRKSSGREEVIAEQPVTLPAGKSVLTIRETLEASGFYTYEARFTPDDRRDDKQSRNNSATAFAYLEGKGRVLLIENAAHPGDFDFLIEQLRLAEIEVDLQNTNQLFTSLAELQPYDCVVLANVPRTTLRGDSDVVMFSDNQVKMLVENTRTLGCGLIVLGGPDSYGAGGWAESELEKALPVDLRIKNARVVPVGALALVIDRSGSMAGQKMSLSKSAAQAAIRSLGPRDFTTVVAFDSAPTTVTPLQRAASPERIAAQIGRLSAAGGTDMYPALDQAVRSLAGCEASVKHCIVLTDGQTPDGGFAALAQRAVRDKITITVVAIGADAQIPLLTNLASRAGGRFYAVRSPLAVPRIFMNEARRVARPLVKDLDPKVTPQVATNHEILSGIDGFPTVGGFVLTTVKESPLVEVVLRSPVPVNDENNVLLATWNYGLGKVATLTTDAGNRWTTDWTNWNGYSPFFSQLVRWSMRPTGNSDRYTINTRETGDGTTTVVIDAVDDDGDFLNLDASMVASVVRPNNEAVPLIIDQVAPGRYIGTFDSQMPGSYLVAVATGRGENMLRTGASVSQGDEWVARQTNLPLLATLAGLEPSGGKPGVLVGGTNPQPLSEQANDVRELTDPTVFDPYRRDLQPAKSVDSVWPMLVVLATVLFLGDVAVRRIQVDLRATRDKLMSIVARVFWRRPVADTPATLDRLRARKAAVQQQLSEQRYEPTGEATPIAVSTTRATTAIASSATRSQLAQNEPSGEQLDEPPVSYTERLMRAKRAATRQRESRDSGDEST